MNKNEFNSLKSIYVRKFLPSLILLCGFLIILPVFSQGIESFPKFLSDAIFVNPMDVLLSIFFPFLFFLYSQFLSRNYVKKMIFNEDILYIELFGFAKNIIIKLEYKDINSLLYSDDPERNFVFTLKNKDKKVIYAQINDKEKAFDLIQKKIKNPKFILNN